MKSKLIAAAAAALLATSVWAQPGPMGPGMMGGYGPGYGMGPGMMGGYGPGYGMGPGMMGGYGPGYGMGPGMMGGYGPGYGMGPGMMGGYGPGWGLATLNLTDAQRGRITDIQREASRKQWDVMGKVHEQQYRLQELYESGKADDDAARKAYAAMADAHKQMFDIQLEARKKIDAVLTPEQREQLRQGGRGRWGAPRPGGQK